MYSGPYFDKKLEKWVSIVLQLRVDPSKIIQRCEQTLKNIFKGDPNF